MAQTNNSLQTAVVFNNYYQEGGLSVGSLGYHRNDYRHVYILRNNHCEIPARFVASQSK